MQAELREQLQRQQQQQVGPFGALLLHDLKILKMCRDVPSGDQW